MNAPAPSTAPQHRAWRRMMLALIVMTISQCCYYESPATRTWSTPRDLPTYIGGKQFATIHVNQASTINYPGQTGWQLHTRASYLLVAMFVVFGLLIDLGPWWTRWGYWVGVLEELVERHAADDFHDARGGVDAALGVFPFRTRLILHGGGEPDGHEIRQRVGFIGLRRAGFAQT